MSSSVHAITNSQVVLVLVLRLLLIPRHYSTNTITCNIRTDDVDVIRVLFDTTTNTNATVGSASASTDTTFVVLAFILVR